MLVLKGKAKRCWMTLTKEDKEQYSGACSSSHALLRANLIDTCLTDQVPFSLDQSNPTQEYSL